MKKIYTSTRNKNITSTAKDAILEGIASDGGLYVYDDIKKITLPLANMMKMNYEQIAKLVLGALLPDFSEAEVEKCIHDAYAGKFHDDRITPLVKAGDDYILELFHGPTSAFKDVGLRMLPQLMSTVLSGKEKQDVMILTATSGDTGKAALEGFKDVEHIGITVFYPNNGVSEVQRLQMVTQEGNNTRVCAMSGNFDDAQTGVKNIFNDADFKAEFAQDGLVFSSANSINIGRLIPQVVYYFDAYRQLVQAQAIKCGEEVNFCVPTGNFGNVLAGYYAKMMGLPVHKFIVASNANNVLYDFINEGVYDRKRPFHKTLSPSMDILVSSNLERLLYYMADFDDAYIKTLMDALQRSGSYQVSDEILAQIQANFYAGYSDDAQTANVIKEKFEACGYVLDPHTAVGYQVMKEYQKQDSEHKTILLSTASPYKFTKAVYTAMFDKAGSDTDEFEDEFAYMKALHEKSGVAIPEGLATLANKEIIHRDVIDKDTMKEYIRDVVKGKQA